jgi:hypothetical protein
MLDLLFLRVADVTLQAANADANEVVPTPMVRLSKRLSKMIASIIGASVVTTQYETSKCETRDKEHVCSIER